MLVRAPHPTLAAAQQGTQECCWRLLLLLHWLLVGCCDRRFIDLPFFKEMTLVILTAYSCYSSLYINWIQIRCQAVIKELKQRFNLAILASFSSALQLGAKCMLPSAATGGIAAAPA
jgi:hypothetical protein